MLLISFIYKISCQILRTVPSHCLISLNTNQPSRRCVWFSRQFSARTPLCTITLCLYTHCAHIHSHSLSLYSVTHTHAAHTLSNAMHTTHAHALAFNVRTALLLAHARLTLDKVRERRYPILSSWRMCCSLSRGQR